METYPLDAPTLESAHVALRRLYGPHSEDLWQTLLFSAGLTGTETDPAAFRRMATSMLAAGGVTQLCGRALAVRADAFTRLSEEPAAPAGTSPFAEGHAFSHRAEGA
jgi:hypothetical protein